MCEDQDERNTSKARAKRAKRSLRPLETIETYPDNVEFKREKQTLKQFALNAPLQIAVLVEHTLSIFSNAFNRAFPHKTLFLRYKYKCARFDFRHANCIHGNCWSHLNNEAIEKQLFFFYVVK